MVRVSLFQTKLFLILTLYQDFRNTETQDPAQRMQQLVWDETGLSSGVHRLYSELSVGLFCRCLLAATLGKRDVCLVLVLQTRAPMGQLVGHQKLVCN